VSVRDDLKRYDLFGWDYEAINPLAEAEVAWHVTWVRRTGGPVLGLACGTGRLLARLAAAGFETLGLDLSDAMLARAQENASSQPPGAQRLVSLVKADMSRFDLGRQFGLVFIADNSFRELRTRKALLTCLRCARRHLRDGGRLLVTERRFNPSLYADGVRRFGWSQPTPHPRTGEPVSRRGELRLSKDHRRLIGKFIYRTTHSDGTQTLEECPINAPILTKPEYLGLFCRAGFTTQVFTGYREMEDDGSDPILCFVCTKQNSRY
jgi:SAM-dependent methyltransferase